MNRKGVLALIAVCLALCAIGRVAVALDKPKDKAVVFNVPTSGRIMDVIYAGEFDEWWVKCREGDNIVVYTYDRRSKSWGRVLFVPKAQEEASRKPGKLESGSKSEPSVPEARAPKEGSPEEPRKTMPDGKKVDSTKAAKPEKKWWDPLTILKKGEQLIRSPGLDGKKETNPDDARKIKSRSGDRPGFDIE